MPKFIAFLRAINVGGHTVKMDHLRKLFEALGCDNVETFIASGNVIFRSTSRNAAALEKKIEVHLRGSLGYDVATFLRTPAELAEVAGHKPFPSADLNAPGSNLYIAFVKDKLGSDSQRKVTAFTSPIDSFHVHGREVYWLCRKTSSQSGFSGAVLEKALQQPATFRNATTVRKMAAQYG